MTTFGLTDAQIREIAPSVFATHAAPAASSRYAYIGSYDIVRMMRNLGFQPVMVREGKKKQPQGRAFALHEIRFQRQDHMQAVAEAGMGGLIPQLLLRNAHDMTSGLQVEAGSLRVACLNGMCHPGEQFGGFRVRHAGDPSKRLDETYKGMAIIRERLDNVLQVAGEWRRIRLQAAQVERLVQLAQEARGTTMVLDPISATAVRRDEDFGDDLWSVFNRIQENITKGGISGTNRKSQPRSIRPVSTLAADVEFNRRFWVAASELAKEVKPASLVIA